GRTGSSVITGVCDGTGASGGTEASGVAGASGGTEASGVAGAFGGTGAFGSVGDAGAIGGAGLPSGAVLVPAGWRERAEINLSPGVPDLSGFPRTAWLRAERLVLERASVADLGYGDPRGTAALRTELAG